MKLIDQIISEIKKSPMTEIAFKDLFCKYGMQVLGDNSQKLSENDVDLCLRIADIFSKVPEDFDNSTYYHSVAQKAIYMLSHLYGKREDIAFISDSVLSSLSNYPVRTKMGLDKEEEKYGLVRMIGEKIKMGDLEIPGQKGQFFLLSQKIAYDGFTNKSFSYSGPTSMGKTFLMTTFIRQRINENHNENYAIIVPTKALINELKSEAIQKFEKEILVKNYRVISSANDLQLESNHRFILIMTPERLMYFLIKYKEIILDYVFFDEAHKYMNNKELVGSITTAIREMRHKGVSIMIASQDPMSLPTEIIELSSIVVMHRFSSPAWVKHVQKAITPLQTLTATEMAALGSGEAYLWANKASDKAITQRPIKISIRPRVTKHGGDTIQAVK